DRADLDLHHEVELAADRRYPPPGGKTGEAVEYADGGRALERHEQECLDLAVVELADIGAIAPDDAGLFQPRDTLGRGAARQADAPGQRLHGDARLPGEDAEDRPVDRIRALHDASPRCA